MTLFFDEHLVFEGLHLYNSAVKDGKKDIRMVIVFFVIFFIRFLYFRLDDYTNQGFFRLLPWLSAQFYIKISHFAKTYQVFLSSSVIIRTRNNFFVTIGFLVQCPEHIVAHISHTLGKDKKFSYLF